METGESYDYVIVGAGSAGCVLANRLSAKPDTTVLLLEAGRGDGHPLVHIPIGFSQLIGDPGYDWGFLTEPEAELNGRQIYAPRGKVLGGSSSINALAYVRGHRQDYDDWRALGNVGWSWDDVLPYFLKTETYHGAGGVQRGTDGAVSVTQAKSWHPIGALMLEAFREAGYPTIDDYNAPDALGMSNIQCTTRNGFRHSAAAAYLEPARKHRTLRIETEAFVTRLLCEDRKAVGVEFIQGRQKHVARARREIIVSAGAVNSPRLLEHSGIGDADVLKPLGIDVVHHLPGVGDNLQDHLFVHTRFHLRNITTVNQAMHAPRLYGHVLRFGVMRDGLIAGGPTLLMGFGALNASASRPDTQFYANGATHSFGTRKGQPAVWVDRFPAIALGGNQSRPKSRGSVHITSSDPDAPPSLKPNYLSDPGDRAHAIAIVRACRKVFAQPAFDPYRGGSETLPRPEVESDEGLLEHVKGTAYSLFHLSCTCRMGNDARAVVDDSLRLRGLGGVRVIDASVMPNVISANTNATTLMIAEKGADLVLADHR